MTSARRWLIIIFCFGVRSPKGFATDGRCALSRQGAGWHLSAPLPIDTATQSEAMRKVRDGLAMTIEYQIAMWSKGATNPEFLSSRCRLLYDLWAEKYVVTKTGGTGPENFPFGKEADAVTRCTGLDLRVSGDLARVEMDAILNPVDEKQQERTRGWLATKGIGGPSSGVISRAIGASLNLKAEKRWSDECSP